jgi:hypothetical protein
MYVENSSLLVRDGGCTTRLLGVPCLADHHECFIYQKSTLHVILVLSANVNYRSIKFILLCCLCDTSKNGKTDSFSLQLHLVATSTLIDIRPTQYAQRIESFRGEKHLLTQI